MEANIGDGSRPVIPEPKLKDQMIEWEKVKFDREPVITGSAEAQQKPQTSFARWFMTSQKNQLRATDEVSRPARTKLRAIRCRTETGKWLPSTSLFFMNRDSKSSDGFSLRAVMASFMYVSTTSRLFFNLFSVPIPKSFPTFHNKPG
uniref:Uncharacterized protein n=1 Tax=Salix viminalis TaxID=40686 RepID=A0A6N2MW71_SALVM